MRKMLVSVLICLMSLVFLGGEQRVALLIANGNYQNFSSLTGPVAEAEQLGAALKRLGFEVELVKNGSREQMLDALDRLRDRVGGRGGVAVFHYGGHGVQVGGNSYLIPVDANVPDEKKVATRTVDVAEIMTSLDSCGSETNIVILDACRNNPLPAASGRSASRGLSVATVKPKNSVIVYSAEAGSVAQDGLFTPALTRALERPGLSMSEVLQEVRKEVYEKSKGVQIPGEYNQLFGPVYLAGAKPLPSPVPAAVEAAGTQGTVTPAAPAVEPAWGQVTVQPGSLKISTRHAVTVELDGQAKKLPANSSVVIDNLSPGSHVVRSTFGDGEVQNRSLSVESARQSTLELDYEPFVLNPDMLSMFPKKTLENPWGGSWEALTDAGNQGNTVGEIVHSALLRQKILRLEYTLKEKFEFRYCAAQLNFAGKVVDFSQYGKLELKYRGSGHMLAIKLGTAKVSDYGYHQYPVKKTPADWQVLQIPFGKFVQPEWAKKVPLDLKQIVLLELCTASSKNKEQGWLEVEYVRLVK